jgi:hypothetical protein
MLILLANHARDQKKSRSMIWKNASNISRQDADKSLIRLKNNLIFVKITLVTSLHLQITSKKRLSARISI